MDTLSDTASMCSTYSKSMRLSKNHRLTDMLRPSSTKPCTCIPCRGRPWERGRPLMAPQAAGKGFGAPAKRQQDTGAPRSTGSTRKKKEHARIDGASSKAVEKALKAVDGKVRPVDPKEAFKGRLDYAQVKDWGSGNADEADALQVTSFEPDARKRGRQAAFYEELAHRLGELEKEGALQIARPKGSPPLPPFEQWSFKERRYIQWLVDMHNCHYALEASVADATVVASTEHYDENAQLRKAFAALAFFTEEKGLDRSLEIAADLNNIAKVSTLEHAVELKPSANSNAYREYLIKLASTCTEEDESHPDQIEQAALRLVANAYLVHVTHLTTGMRIGAAAAEKLNLFPAQALNFYQKWPPGALPDPLAHFIQSTNSAGRALTAEQREAVMQELPKAMPKLTVLLSSLAHAN